MVIALFETTLDLRKFSSPLEDVVSSAFLTVAPNDHHLFTNFNEILGVKQFSDYEKVKETVENWFKKIELFGTGVQNLHLQKNLNNDYVEKY